MKNNGENKDKGKIAYNLDTFTEKIINDEMDTVINNITKRLPYQIFNITELEYSIINMYDNFQDHINNEIKGIESKTNSLLFQKTFIGKAVDGDVNSIVKYSFKDNSDRPETVTNIKLSVNVLDSKLVNPIFHYQTSYDKIIKSIISNNVKEKIELEIQEIKKADVTNFASSELTDQDALFQKICLIPTFIDNESKNASLSEYQYIEEHLISKVKGLKNDIPTLEYNPLNVRENIKLLLDKENVRDNGYNSAVSEFSRILNTHNLSYDYIENLKNARTVIIREYEDDNSKNIPDEHYSLKLSYYDETQLKALREAYNKQSNILNKELYKLWNVTNAISEIGKSFRSIDDYDDLFHKVYASYVSYKRRKDKSFNENELKNWEEVYFIKPELNEMENQKDANDYNYRFDNKIIGLIKDKLKSIFNIKNSSGFFILESRLNFLEQQFSDFYHNINPNQLQPGLLLDIDIVSIKKLYDTFYKMTSVVNDFLSTVSKRNKDTRISNTEYKKAKTEN